MIGERYTRALETPQLLKSKYGIATPDRENIPAGTHFNLVATGFYGAGIGRFYVLEYVDAQGNKQELEYTEMMFPGSFETREEVK